MDPTITTKAGDAFEWELPLPAPGDDGVPWTGLVGTCSACDPRTGLKKFDIPVTCTVNGDGTATVLLIETGTNTANWNLGAWVIDVSLRIPSTWGPFSTNDIGLIVQKKRAGAAAS
jgi:hypothetical protein